MRTGRWRIETMKSLTLFLIILCLSVITIKCSKDSSPTAPQETTLFGSWNWVISKGGYAGTWITPAFVGYTQKVVFNLNDLVQFYKNDSLVETYKFSIYNYKFSVTDSGKAIHYQDSSRFIPDDIIMRLDRDTLILSEYCYDCYERTYARIK